MRKTIKYPFFGDFPALGKVRQYANLAWLNSNNPDKTSFLAIGKIDEITTNSFQTLKDFYEEKQDWLFGYFSYDLKNEIEQLKSENFDGLKFPLLHFFQPEYVLKYCKNEVEISYLEDHTSETAVKELYQILINRKPETGPDSYRDRKPETGIKPRITRKEYLDIVQKLKQHIQIGDVYEINFCQEFYAENAEIDPVETYLKLNRISPTPFSCFYRMDDKYLMCASPERFMKKEGSRIISQPVKGTIKRGSSKEKDELLKQELLQSAKEKSENVMIVDLVRNDLSKSAKKNTVKVDELCGIYTFPQVHQMISTVSAELRDDIHFIDALKNAFPMGSMTGAPKVRTMQLIEKHERTKRGLFSGAVGYITPGRDFDFNVVIRSMLYNATEKYLSFMVGGAITDKSVPEKEYEECLLKAKAIFETLGIDA